jgi:hypothetical protein
VASFGAFVNLVDRTVAEIAQYLTRGDLELGLLNTDSGFVAPVRSAGAMSFEREPVVIRRTPTTRFVARAARLATAKLIVPGDAQ